MIDSGELQLFYFSAELMIAAAVTKELSQEKFTAFVNAMILEHTTLDQSGRLEEHDAARFFRSENKVYIDFRQGLIHACETMGDSNKEPFYQSHLD